MNEVFVAEPSSCENLEELRHLLSLFGPKSGRYLASYPVNWSSLLKKHFSQLPPIETERLKTILRRALEQVAIVNNTSLAWDSTSDWIDNALKLPPRVNQIVASPETKKTGATTVAELDLPPTADEKVEATPSEYVRVCKTLLIISPELIFVDPYLNPCRSDMRDVLEEMLKAVKIGKCQRVTCWARESHVVGERSFSWQEVEGRIRAMLLKIEWPKDRNFEYLLVDDAHSTEKMHGRYLVSIKGGIRLEQGFQRLSKGRSVDISPVGSKVHDDLLRYYYEGLHGMKVTQRFKAHP